MAQTRDVCHKPYDIRFYCAADTPYDTHRPAFLAAVLQPVGQSLWLDSTRVSRLEYPGPGPVQCPVGTESVADIQDLSQVVRNSVLQNF